MEGRFRSETVPDRAVYHHRPDRDGYRLVYAGQGAATGLADQFDSPAEQAMTVSTGTTRTLLTGLAGRLVLARR